jgi:hypothetical protein
MTPAAVNVVPAIGRCIGCYERARLHDGACEDCLTRRGRKWVITSARCRIDPAFALEVFSRITNDRGRRDFLRMYGPGVLALVGGGPANDV